MKKLLWILLISVLGSMTVIFVANRIVEGTTDERVYDDLHTIPHNRVGLLLGTSSKFSSGQPNTYFVHRIQAAVRLFEAHKIDYIVVSGDSSGFHYNEPRDMKNALVQKGIPATRIFQDYAGFRTLDSVVRLYKIFGQNKFTVISQEFHNRRAIYIACSKKLDVIGYNAKDVDRSKRVRTNLREKLARVYVFVDLLLNKEPQLLGKSIVIK